MLILYVFFSIGENNIKKRGYPIKVHANKPINKIKITYTINNIVVKIVLYPLAYLTMIYNLKHCFISLTFSYLFN